ncbi:MAG: hypothetical protein AAFV19_02150 [Pseudomonadota bacterium]
MRRLPAIAAILALTTACAELSETQEGEVRSVDAFIEPLGERRFAVEVTAINLDGYEVARCLAAGYADQQRDEDGEVQFPVFIRDGGKIVDEFRRKEGIRTQTSKGIQTYSLTAETSPEDHDGRDIVAVALQLASCEQDGLPTTVE